MSDVAPAKLYTPELLSLAVQLANFPLDDDLQFRSQARSRTCGGTLEIGLSCGADGKITRIGLLVSACAVGQAAAALLAKNATGQDAETILAALTEIENWLNGASDAPNWPGIAVLGPAIARSARHGAILLPWRAALAALPNAVTAR